MHGRIWYHRIDHQRNAIGELSIGKHQTASAQSLLRDVPSIALLTSTDFELDTPVFRTVIIGIIRRDGPGVAITR